MSKLLTYEDVARLFQCTERHVYNLVKREGLPRIKVGKSVRFDAADVQRFFESKKTKGVSDASE